MVYLRRKYRKSMYEKPKVVGNQRRRRQKVGDRKVHRDQPRSVGLESRDIQGCMHVDQPRTVGLDNGLGRGCSDPGMVTKTENTKRNL